MKRAMTVVVVVLMAMGFGLSAAQAGKNKKKKKAAASQNSPAIADSMGDLTWGMSHKQLMKKLKGKINAKYRPRIAKTHSAVEEDSLRHEAKEEVRRIKDSFVRFQGKTTGWDVSFLRGEFTHNNDESMIVVRDRNSQNFYFFIGGRLWKWYKAFDASVFDAGDFEEFAGAVQRRFGEAKEVRGEATPGAGKRHWLEWQDKGTRLRAIDQTDFYGFYCLIFEEKATVANLARLRTNRSDRGSKRHSVVEAVTSDSGGTPDDQPHIVDRITGKIRDREDAPSSSSSRSGSSSRRSSKSSSSSTRAPSSGGVASDDDPLRGLGL